MARIGTGKIVFALTCFTLLLAWWRPTGTELWPSLLALLLVFATRNVLGGLFGGALAGVVLLNQGDFWRLPIELIEQHLLPNFSSSWKVGAILFTLLLGGMVHLLEKGGLLQAFFIRVLKGGSARRVETGAACFGLVCFFDGLANSLMVGKIFQPLADLARVSRLRLAYIADTTSSAVACLAFISTWIAFQLSMIREGFTLAGRIEMANPYHLFFLSWPHNYYAIFALLLMSVAIARQWHIGPMRSAIAQAGTASAAGLKTTDAVPAVAVSEPVDPDTNTPVAGTSAGLWRAWVPIAALLTIVFAGIYMDGTFRMNLPLWPLEWEKLALSFSEAHVPAVLIFASAAGSVIAWYCFPSTSFTSGDPRSKVYFAGVTQLFKPVIILVLAWTLSSTLRELGTATFLGNLLSGRMPIAILPVSIFVSSAVVAFTTGTSWGTMGLMMPISIPLAFALAGGADAASADALAMQYIPFIIAAVFSGAVFGDHCSPISDTTIVSSIAAGVAPIDHVRTQLPYAMIAAGAAALLGFLPAGLLPNLSMWPIAAAGIFFATILLLSRSRSLSG